MMQAILVPARRHEEFTRDHAGALVDQLVECVLAVCTRLTPNNGTGMLDQIGPVHADALAVAFHLKLLKIGR